MAKYMTVDQIAQILGCSRKRAANLMSEENIRHIRVYPEDIVYEKVIRPRKERGNV